MMTETAEELRKRPEIRKELDRATGQKQQEATENDHPDKFWFVAYAVALAVLRLLLLCYRRETHSAAE